MQIERMWLVTKPTRWSLLADVLCEVSVTGLCNQFRGGLDPQQVIGLYDNEPEARQVAAHALVDRDATERVLVRSIPKANDPALRGRKGFGARMARRRALAKMTVPVYCPNHPDRPAASPSSSNLCGPCLMGKPSEPTVRGGPGERGAAGLPAVRPRPAPGADDAPRGAGAAAHLPEVSHPVAGGGRAAGWQRAPAAGSGDAPRDVGGAVSAWPEYPQVQPVATTRRCSEQVWAASKYKGQRLRTCMRKATALVRWRRLGSLWNGGAGYRCDRHTPAGGPPC